MWELLSDPTTDKINVSHIPITTSGSGDFVSSITVNSGTPGSITVSYGSLPIAATNRLGIVKVGSGLSITNEGVLSANGYNLPLASSNDRGGIKIGYTTSAANRNYALQLDSNEKAYVNVPWTDTTYKLTLNGTAKGTTGGTDLGSFYAPTGAGTSGYILKSNGSGEPS